MGFLKDALAGMGGGGAAGGGEMNPGMKMFGMAAGSNTADAKPDFMHRFGTALKDELFKNAMQGWGGGLQ